MENLRTGAELAPEGLSSHTTQMEALGAIARVMATCSRQSETLRSALETLERKLGLINGMVMLLTTNSKPMPKLLLSG